MCLIVEWPKQHPGKYESYGDYLCSWSGKASIAHSMRCDYDLDLVKIVTSYPLM